MGNSFCKTTKDIILQRTDGKCFYCGCKLSTEPFAKNEFVIDHVTPRSKGGRSGVGMNNLVASCRSCNASKGALSLEYYRLCVSIGNKFDEIGVSFTSKQISFLSKNGFDFGFIPVVFFGEKDE